MKHIKTTLSLIVLLASSFTLNAEGVSAFTKKGISYTILDKEKLTVAIAPSTLPKGTEVLEIPQTVKISGKSYTVTTIGQNAFKGADITEIVLPATVTEIEDYSFANCLYLNKLVFPEHHVNVAKSAFLGCTSLSDVTFGDGWSVLDLSPFASCTALKDIYVPAKARVITGLASLSSLTGINVDASNPVYSSMNGMLFDKSQETLMFCPAAFDKQIVVPEGTVTVRRGALASCLFTEDIELPATLKYLDYDEFACMRNLSSLKFGSDDVINTASFGGKPVLSLEMSRTATVYVPRKSFGQYVASLSSLSGTYTSLSGRSRKKLSEDSLLDAGQIKKYRSRKNK